MEKYVELYYDVLKWSKEKGIDLNVNWESQEVKYSWIVNHSYKELRLSQSPNKQGINFYFKSKDDALFFKYEFGYRLLKLIIEGK